MSVVMSSSPEEVLSEKISETPPRSNLTMTPMNQKDIPIPTRQSSSSDSEGNSEGSARSQGNRLARSFNSFIHSPASWAKKHNIISQSNSNASSPTTKHQPKLNEKYGNYIKPTKHTQRKATGATNKNNIGSGATAVIRLVQSNQRTLAVKEFLKKEKNEQPRDYSKRMQNEYCISKTVSGHPHVVSTIDLIQDEKDRWCTVMEYCDGGDLFNLMQVKSSLPVMECACLFKQMMLGLQHLHHLGVAHRDIKPENLLLTQGGTLKIGDFGCADVVQSCFEKEPRQCHEWCGSEPFWSPEIWFLRNKDDAYDGLALDIWSAAATFFCVRFSKLLFAATFYTGKPPHSPPAGSIEGSPAAVSAAATDGGDREFGNYVEQRKTLEDPKECDIWNSFETDTPLTDDEKECLAGMLDPDPKTRWTVDQVLDSKWLKSIEMCNDGELENGWRHYHSLALTS